MKKVALWLLVGAVASLIHVGAAQALPPFKKGFTERYGFETAQVSCDCCHIPKKSKKMRNEYGMALSEFLNAEDFKGDDKLEDDAAMKVITEALTKVEPMASEAGPTWKELIESKKLPGLKVD